MPHHFLGVVLSTNIILYEHKLCGYSRRHLCPRVLAAGGKEGSLQTSDQSRRPKQCLFWYLIPDAPDQKWREAPLSISQINHWNSLPAEVGQTQVIHVTFIYGNFLASFSKSQKTNWTTIGVNKQFFNTLQQSRLSPCMRQSFKVSLDTPKFRSKSRVSSTRARAIICATRRNFRPPFARFPIYRFLHFFLPRLKKATQANIMWRR